MFKLPLTFALAGSVLLGCGSSNPSGSSSSSTAAGATATGSTAGSTGSTGSTAASTTSSSSGASTTTSTTSAGPGSTGSGSTGGTATNGSSGSTGSGPVLVSQPGELVLPGARFSPDGRFVIYTVATGTPLTAAAVRAFDTTTRTSHDLGTPFGICGISACTVLPEIIGMAGGGTFAAIQETTASPPALDGVSVIDLATGNRTPVTFTSYNEHLVTAFADGAYLSVLRTFTTHSGAITYYPAGGGSAVLSSTTSDPDSSAGIAIGQVGGKSVVVAALSIGGAHSVDVYPLDGSASTHLGTGEKVWVVGDQVLFYDSSGPTLSQVSISGGTPVPVGTSPLALDASSVPGRGPQFTIAAPLASPDQSTVLLSGTHAVALSLENGSSTPTVVNASAGPEFYDAQTLFFGTTDTNGIPSVQFAKLTDAAASTLAPDSKFFWAYNGQLLYGAETVFRVGSMTVKAPNLTNAMPFSAGDLFDPHLFSGAGDQAIWTESVTDLAGSPNGVAMTRFDFDAQNGNAPLADDGLYFLPLR